MSTFDHVDAHTPQATASRRSFGRHVLHAVLLAVAAVAIYALAPHVFGTSAISNAMAMALLGVAVLALWFATATSRWRRRLLGSLVLVVTAGAFFVLGGTLGLFAIAMAVIPMLLQPWLIGQPWSPRRFMVDAFFVASGLALAWLVFVPSALGLFLAVWMFFLVQAIRQLVADESLHRQSATHQAMISPAQNGGSNAYCSSIKAYHWPQVKTIVVVLISRG